MDNIVKLCLAFGLCVPMRAFVAAPLPTIHSRGCELLSGSSHDVNKVELAKQELMIAFRMMDEKDLDFMQLGKDEFQFIAKYVEQLVSSAKSSEGQHSVSMLLKEGKLCGCWKLKWSDEYRFNIFPPLGIEVMNYIFEPESDGGRLDNVLHFKNSPLHSIRIITKYKVDDDKRSRLVLDFNSIVVDLWGLNIPFPFFCDNGGYIEIQYYDGVFWVERLEKILSDGSKRQYTSIYLQDSQPLTDLDKKRVISKRILQTTN